MYTIPKSFLFLILLALGIQAHVRWIVPPERDNADLKIAPCGGVPAKGLMAEWTAGDTIPLKFEEYINHPGWYIIYFSPGGEDNFTLIDSIPDTLNIKAIWDYKYVVPDVECTSCILRIRMHMTDKNPPNQYYHSCFDFSIKKPTSTLIEVRNSNVGDQKPYSIEKGIIRWESTHNLKDVAVYSPLGLLIYHTESSNIPGIFSLNLNELNLLPGVYLIKYNTAFHQDSFEIIVDK